MDNLDCAVFVKIHLKSIEPYNNIIYNIYDFQ